VNKIQKLIRKLKSDERGLSTVEYVVLLVLIVAVAVALWNVFGNTVTGKLQEATTQFDNNVGTTKATTGSTVGAATTKASTVYTK
jgi:Flp pilus assembly pilin Flp